MKIARYEREAEGKGATNEFFPTRVMAASVRHRHPNERDASSLDRT